HQHCIFGWEAPIIAFKQKLLSAESPFPLDYQISAHLDVLKERSLDQAKLKQFSHEQREHYAMSSETGSVKDLVMGFVLTSIETKASFFDSVFEDTPPEDYSGLMMGIFKKALQALLGATKYNSDAKRIVEDYLSDPRRQGKTPSEVWKDLLHKMADIKFAPFTNTKKAPNQEATATACCSVSSGGCPPNSKQLARRWCRTSRYN
ncbi:unnamed protein product, partial [Cylindrotheca closterium]